MSFAPQGPYQPQDSAPYQNSGQNQGPQDQPAGSYVEYEALPGSFAAKMGNKVRNRYATLALSLGVVAFIGCWLPGVYLVEAVWVTIVVVAAYTGGKLANQQNGVGKGRCVAAVVLAVLSVLGVVASAVHSVLNQQPAEHAASNPNLPRTLDGKMGVTIVDRDVAFRVNSARCGLKTSGGSLPVPARGQFCKVNVTVTNKADSPTHFDAGQVLGVIGKGLYKSDAGAGAAYLDDINPGKSLVADVLIDIPVGKTLDGVELHGSLVSDGVGVAVK